MPEDKARKRAVRARMAQTGERYTTAARKLGSDGPSSLPATCPDCRGAELDFRRTGERSVTVSCRECGSDNVYPVTAAGPARRPTDPPVAERDWSTIARVRITRPYRAGSVSPWDERRFEAGEELEMNQHGRAGRPVERDAWWTSFDIDGAFIIPAGHVEVLEVIRERPPTFAAAALPGSQVADLFGSGAAGWAQLGILTVPGLYDFEIRASGGELLGLIERGGTAAGYVRPHPAAPLTYRAVIRDDGSDHPPAVRFPAGFLPPDPARAAAAERARWGGTAAGMRAAVRPQDGLGAPLLHHDAPDEAGEPDGL